MSKELIYREDAVEVFGSYIYRAFNYVDFGVAKGDIRELLSNIPAVDAVEVVRCKDCKHNKTEECPMIFYNGGDKNRPMWWSKDDGFCHFGERKDHEQRTDL